MNLQACIFLCCCSLEAQFQLPSYNVDQDHITISGFSSGGYMAVQMHVSYSATFRGVGVISGGPYHCAWSVPESERTFPELANPQIINVTKIQAIAEGLSEKGQIDSLEQLKSTKVFLLAGSLDTLIVPEVVEKTRQFYTKFVKDSNIHFEEIRSVHCFPTMNYGAECEVDHVKLINNCAYNAAFKILNHIETNIIEPQMETTSTAPLRFNISETLLTWVNLTAIGMDEIAYVFVPDQCKSRSIRCKLHVALHGCTQGVSTIGEDYVLYTGYNEVAEANNMIILYPQAKIIPDINPFGCWDWMGTTGPLYATKQGPQILVIMKLVQHLTGITIL